MTTTQIQMPQYKCHKTVWALRIKAIDKSGDGDVRLEFFDELFAPRPVSAEYMSKHNPSAGGYFVVYKDGYESFSPQHAFENGYMLID